jgi:SAM-dependent methyltransferase
MRVCADRVNCYGMQHPRQAWQSVAEKMRGGVWELEHALFLRLLARHSVSRPGMIIDAGGGWGRFAYLARKQGQRVVVADSSHVQVTVGRQYYSRRRARPWFVEARIDLPLPFRRDTFAMGMCMGNVISCAPAAAVLRQLRRVLQPGGLLIGTAIDYESVSGPKVLCPKAAELSLEECFLRAYSPRMLDSLFVRCGYSLVLNMRQADFLAEECRRDGAFRDKVCRIRCAQDDLRHEFATKRVYVAKKAGA